MTQKELNEKYLEQEDGSYKCKNCGTDIMGKKVFHSVWDGIFGCSGSGDVRTEIKPYCPKCDKEPNSNGLPVYED